MRQAVVRPSCLVPMPPLPSNEGAREPAAETRLSNSRLPFSGKPEISFAFVDLCCKFTLLKNFFKRFIPEPCQPSTVGVYPWGHSGLPVNSYAAEGKWGTEVKTERQSWEGLKEGLGLIFIRRTKSLGLGEGVIFDCHSNQAERGLWSSVSQG